MSYSVKELNGSGVVEGDDRGQRGQRLFHVQPYSAWRDFVVGQMGLRQDVGGQIVQVIPPQRFSPGSRLWASRFKVEGLGVPGSDASGGPDYDGGAKIAIHYQTRDFDQDSRDRNRAGTYLTETLSFSSEFLPHNKLAWKWDDGTPLDQDDPDPAGVIPKVEWRITRHQVPDLPFAEILNDIGTVNSAALKDAAAGTLLFLGAEARREHTSEGNPAWEVEMVFEYRRQQHNKLLRASSGDFELCKTINGGNRLYDTADHADLVPELE